jgi:SAM-dependent methyltransferase
MTLGPSLRQLIKRSKWAMIGYTIAHSCHVRTRFSHGEIDSVTGSTHMSLRIDQSVSYINRTYDDYCRYGQVRPDSLYGKTILEGGPGDNLGVALRFIATGAARVFATDKFYAHQNAVQQRKIYLALRDQLPQEQKQRYDRAVDLSGDVVFNEELIKPVYGKGMEDLGAFFDPHMFDMIISRGVIQEIYDTDRVIAGMDKVLRPGGLMLHKIDLRDYGLFSGNGHHPLEFLTISDPIYRWMTRDSDRPSRKTCDYYRRKMAAYGYDANLLITTVVRVGYAKRPIEVLPHKTRLERGVDYTDDTLNLIRSIRPRLARRFRDLSDEDLMVSGIFIVARKSLLPSQQESP